MMKRRKNQKKRRKKKSRHVVLLTKCRFVLSGSECQIYLWDSFGNTSMPPVTVKQIV